MVWAPKSSVWLVASRVGGHAEWELVLDDIYEAVLGHLSPADAAALRCTCRCLRSKTDLLLRTLHLSRPHVKRAAARFQVTTFYRRILVESINMISSFI